MTPTFDPIVAWPIIAAVAALIVGLTLWAYAKRLRGTSGAWRWFALALRMIAILMCVLASLRPSILFQTKSQQPSTVAFLSDVSRSMTLKDAAGGKSRWDAERNALADGLKAAKGLGSKVIPRAYRFDSKVSDDKPEDRSEPKGTETALGSAMQEVVKRNSGGRILALVVLSDGAYNSGFPPLVAAGQMKAQGVPVVTVGFGSDTASEQSRDVSIKALNVNPTVYVKNDVNITGTLSARGYGGQEMEVELLAEGQSTPVQTVKVKVPEKGTEVPITGLKWTPTKSGETKLTLRVKEQPGELVKANNEFSTYVTVLGGGLNVLYLTGPYGVWEHRFLVRSLDASQKIQLTLRQIRQPEDPNAPTLNDDFAPNAFDVYILGDLPAEYLTADQKDLLVKRVMNGSGLIMLGGRGSFGEGGWAGTRLADILPTRIGRGDGQMEPPDGLKMVANPRALDAYVLKLSNSRADSQKLWDSLPPIPGANRLGPPKDAATVWASTPDGEPMMVGQDVGRGRVMEFGGETWPWARFSEESRLVHIKFWRQAILWLAHKEDENDSQVRLALDRRRVAVGGRVELTVRATDSKGEAIPGARYEATVTPVTPPSGATEKVDVFAQGTEGHGSHFVTGQPGDYKVSVTAFNSAGQAIGTDNARFLAYQDDRELENPAADLDLLKRIAELTGGKNVPPEGLAKYLASLDKSIVSEYVTQKDVRLWDNWWFLMIFASILTLEWFLRKRHGWV